MRDELMESWLDDLELESLPDGTARRIAEVAGIRALCSLSKEFGGTLIYVPKMETYMAAIRDKRLALEFNGANLHEMARKYGLSQASIYRIVQEQRNKAADTRPQLKLFPDWPQTGT